MADPNSTLTDAEREAVAVTLAGVGIIDPRAHADVRATMARLLAAARADERERCVAALIEAAPQYGFGMNHDGTEDLQASAYVEGWHDAWATLTQPADTKAADR